MEISKWVTVFRLNVPNLSINKNNDIFSLFKDLFI
jgi:hypothetical protein